MTKVLKNSMKESPVNPKYKPSVLNINLAINKMIAFFIAK